MKGVKMYNGEVVIRGILKLLEYANYLILKVVLFDINCFK